eukprot:ANDGO_03406.mRNA.1 hypothetical protein
MGLRTVLITTARKLQKEDADEVEVALGAADEVAVVGAETVAALLQSAVEVEEVAEGTVTKVALWVSPTVF